MCINHFILRTNKTMFSLVQVTCWGGNQPRLRLKPTHSTASHEKVMYVIKQTGLSQAKYLGYRHYIVADFTFTT